MSIEILKGNVLDAPDPALIVPIDGTINPGHGRYERLLGNIGRQFNQKFPETELVEELESQLKLPLPMGCAYPIELGTGKFEQIVVVSTLHHIGEVSPQQKRAIVRASLTAALTVAKHEEVQSIATAVLQGGWRLDAQVALMEMIKAYAAYKKPIAMRIMLSDSQLVESARSLSKGLGLDVV